VAPLKVGSLVAVRRAWCYRSQQPALATLPKPPAPVLAVMLRRARAGFVVLVLRSGGLALLPRRALTVQVT
jgi:hypothetical protein